MPFHPLLPAVEPYATRPDDHLTARPSSTDFAYPLPSDPLPKDTPLPISHALEFVADARAEQGNKVEAAELFADLGAKYDRMRAAYWDFRRRDCL